MKFIRLEIRNFRGVDRAAVDFEPTGVTVIAGPNEVGKSSLSEAISLLFDYPDNSKAQAIRAVAPVHRDEGAEVVLEFRAGPYHATYLKQFNRGTRTELTVRAPSHESLTGRDAHDRAAAILEESVDVALWKALRMQQETPLAYPELDGHGSLSAALDRAAGQARAGEPEHSLFKAAQVEYERYWTLKGGKERAPLIDAAAEVRRLADTAAKLADRLRAVEEDVAESARLERTIADEEKALVELRRLETEHGEARRRVKRLERAVNELESTTRLARSTHAEAALQLKNRNDLLERLERARADDEKLRQEMTQRAPELKNLQTEENSAREVLERMRAAARAAQRAQELARADLEFRRAELDHTQLTERLARVQAAAQAAEKAEEVISRTRVDAETLESIRNAHIEVERARVAANAGSPLLRIEAMKVLELEIDAAPETLPEGAIRDIRVPQALEVRVGNVARVRVEAATDSRSVLDQLDKSQAAYDNQLAQAGVEDLARAIQVEGERAEAARQIEARDRIFRDDLRDLTLVDLKHKVDRLAAQVTAYPEERRVAVASTGDEQDFGSNSAPFPADFDEAQARLEEAGEQAASAERDREVARKEHIVLQDRMRKLEGELGEERAKGEQRELQIRAEADALAGARKVTPDSVLKEAEKAAVAALVKAEEAEKQRREELEAASPEMVRTQADNAERAVKAAEERIRKDVDEQLTLKGRLEAAGREGLAERLAAKEIALARAVSAEAAVQRRAKAAKLLFETLRARRDDARRRYVLPLTKQIQKLGRYVFGDDFSVELGDDLSVIQRTTRGRTVPFDSLSGGTKEQISILARLACALVVAEDGGVPLVFDDALGNSDAARLEALGAVLAIAGQKCQVLVLTCAPERYRNVGTAKVINLRSSGMEGKRVPAGM